MKHLSTDRIAIQISAKELNHYDILHALNMSDTDGCDITWGDTLYDKNLEQMVRITIHDTDFMSVFKLWRTLRRQCAGVDCARVYWRDRDWCAKELYADLVRDGGLL